VRCRIELKWDMDSSEVVWQKGTSGVTKSEALGILDDTYSEARAALLANMTKTAADEVGIVVFVPHNKLQAVMEALG
jgi:hypothetical protein